jgi:hypothetical protein
MRPVTAPADLFSAAATDGMDRPGARISSNRRSSSSVQVLFCCIGTVHLPHPANKTSFQLIISSICSYHRSCCDLQMRERPVSISDFAERQETHNRQQLTLRLMIKRVALWRR